MMNKTKYMAPAVTIIHMEPIRPLAASTLSVGYSDETTTGDANARGYYGFDDDDQDDDSSPRPHYSVW